MLALFYCWYWFCPYFMHNLVTSFAKYITVPIFSYYSYILLQCTKTENKLKSMHLFYYIPTCNTMMQHEHNIQINRYWVILKRQTFLTFLALLLDGLGRLAVGGGCGVALLALLQCERARAHVVLGITLRPRSLLVSAWLWKEFVTASLMVTEDWWWRRVLIVINKLCLIFSDQY